MFQIEENVNFEPLPITVFMAGFSGSGKTFSALRMAKGLSPNGKIVMIATEGIRAKMYAGNPLIPNYSVLNLESPFTQERFINALEQASEYAGKSGTVIIDSITDEHEGEGGLLDQAEKSSISNNLLKWAGIKSRHKRFLAKLYNAKSNIIACVRKNESTGLVPKLDSKGQPIIGQNGKPETESVNIEKATAEKNMLYPFTIGIDIQKNHSVIFNKFPIQLLGDWRYYLPEGVITEESGKRLAEKLGFEQPKMTKADVIEQLFRIEDLSGLESFYKSLPNGKEFVNEFADRKRELLHPHAETYETLSKELI